MRVFLASRCRCYFCNELMTLEEMDIHHVIMRKDRGKNTDDNLVATHRACHIAHHEQ
jgi:5-methylcytosine-specific restriction endonuclease McrA